MARIFPKMSDRRGTVLVIVMGLAALMALGAISLGTMISQNIELIRRAKFGAQAQYLAEAGINQAFARFKSEGFTARSAFTGTLDTGSFRVTFSERGGRYLITSVGTASDVSKTVSSEVMDRTPSAMYCICSADDDIRINALIARADVVGDIHANHNVYLRSDPIVGHLYVDGDVSATGIVQEGSRLHATDGFWGLWLDAHVYINGVNNDNAVIIESANRKRLPTFNLDAYKEAAEDSGDYYDTSQVFNNRTLSPGNGIVYVNGTATFQGTCTLNGGIIANSIRITGRLEQNKTGNRNLILSQIGDIGVLGRLETEEAVVFAGRDLISLQIGATINVNGVMLAKRDIYMWDILTNIDYTHVDAFPSDMGDEDDQLFGIVSWNR